MDYANRAGRDYESLNRMKRIDYNGREILIREDGSKIFVFGYAPKERGVILAKEIDPIDEKERDKVSGLVKKIDPKKDVVFK